MKKIAHFIDSNDPGGAETLIIELGKALKIHGYAPEVFFFNNPWLEEHCRGHEIPFHIVPYESLYRSKYTLPLFIVLFTWFLRKHQVYLVHTHLFDTVLPTSLAAKILGKPHVATLHDKYSIENSRFRMAALKLAARVGSKLVPVSRDINRLLVTSRGFKEEHLRTIYNGVDMQKYDDIQRLKNIDGTNLSPKDFVFICVARLVKIKAHDVLIAAFEKLVSKELPVKLLLAGDGPLMENYSVLVNEKQLDKQVIFLGQRNDVDQLLKASDCFILVSMSEGLSCSIMEAMAAGLPVIATNVGGNPELIEQGENGCLVRTGDVDSIYKNMLTMVNDRDKTNKMGKTSKLKVMAEFSIDSMVSKYIELYEA